MFESYDQDIGMLTNKTAKKLTAYLNGKLEQKYEKPCTYLL
jgi:hypothetical protein